MTFPRLGRWFLLRITPLAGPRPGLLVSHVNITRRKMAEIELERRASHDPLTGLANRALVRSRLQELVSHRNAAAAPRDTGTGVLYIDLDHFKPINDRFGHTAGDELLQEMARRLVEAVRPCDLVGRLGGDEFVVIAPRMTTPRLGRLALRVERALAATHVVHGESVPTAASVGTHLAPAGQDAEHALDRADKEMYSVKRSRRAEQTLPDR